MNSGSRYELPEKECIKCSGTTGSDLLGLSTQNQSCDSECDQLAFGSGPVPKAEQRRGHGFDFQGVHELITSALDKYK